MSLAILGGNMVGEGGGADQLRAELLSGECIPALAKNLYTEVDIEQTGQSFVARTTAGSASVRSGASMLKKLYGAVSRTQAKVTESISSSKTEMARFSVTVDDATFVAITSEATFTYDGTDWKVDGSVVSLATYGVTLNGNVISGDCFTVAQNEPATTTTVIYYQEDRFGFSLTQATFKAKANESVQKGQSHSFVFTYGDSGWACDGVTYTGGQMNSVWGIGTLGDYMAGDIITINYTRASNGKLEFAAPTALKALGLNSCNCFDPNSMVLPNRIINESGAIVAQQGSYVCYAKAVYNASNTNGYAVYDKNASVTSVGWVATLPTTSTTGITLGNANAQLSHVTFAQNGYIVVACTNVNGLCIHPSWSGVEDKTYTAYRESVFNIPTTEVSEAPLQGIGWAVGSYRNTFDFSAKTYTWKVDRIAYSASALAELIAAHPTWVEDTDYSYDNDWIYYHFDTSAVVNLPATADGIYYCNDYSTEEFVGTSIAPLADFVYGQNLSDKLRSDVLTRSQAVAMVVTFDDETTATYNVLTNQL